MVCPLDSSLQICSLLTEVGDGLGALANALITSLPAFLIILGAVGAVVLIIKGIAKRVGGGVSG